MRVSRLPPLPTGLIVSQQFLFMSAKRGAGSGARETRKADKTI